MVKKMRISAIRQKIGIPAEVVKVVSNIKASSLKD